MALRNRIIGPGKHTAAQRAAADAFPRHGQHGGYAPSAYDLLWVVVDPLVPGGVQAYATAKPDGDVLHCRGSYVAPIYRGGGLQRRLLMARVRYARRHGFRVVRTYVAPANIPSLVNILRAGFLPTRVSDGFLELERKP